MIKFNKDKNGIRAVLNYYLDKNHLENTPDKDIAEEISLQAGVDLSIWRIKQHRIIGNIWTVNGKFGSGTAQHWDEATNGQVKVIIDYERIAPDNKNEFRNEFIKEISNKSKKVRTKNYPKLGNMLSLVDIPDHHLGRLSYGKETGDNYDIKIAVDRYEQSVDFFINELSYISKKHPLGKILFVVGNDFFNYDIAKPYPMTSNGTPQESDVRFQRMFTTGSTLICRQLELLSKLAPVDVIVIPGNHDEMLSYMLGQVLFAWFRNNANVNVNISPKPREYYQWGKNMLGFSHGQYETFERLFANMALEDKLMWANTVYKYHYTGHLHHAEKRVKLQSGVKEYNMPKKPILLAEDLNGVMFDRLASLTSNDYYESSRGYIHIKAAESFLFSKIFGKIHSIHYQLPISINS